VDIRLRRGLLYQRLRRASLALSLVVTIGLPLWHLHAIAVASGGVAGPSRWAALAGALGFPDRAPPVVGGPTSIRVFGLEIVDPVAVVSALGAAGPSRALLIAAPVGLLLVVLLGRFFCGWICPYVPVLAASNAVRSLLARHGRRPRDVALPRRSALLSLAVLLLAGALTGSQILLLFYPPAVISREVFRAVFYGGLGLGALFIGAAFLFDTFVARAGFCRYLCPGGALFGLVGALSPVQVKRRAADCTDCTLCDQVCNMLQGPMTDRLDSGCDRCGKCVSACPTGALRITAGRPVTLALPDAPPGGRP